MESHTKEEQTYPYAEGCVVPHRRTASQSEHGRTTYMNSQTPLRRRFASVAFAGPATPTLKALDSLALLPPPSRSSPRRGWDSGASGSGCCCGPDTSPAEMVCLLFVPAGVDRGFTCHEFNARISKWEHQQWKAPCMASEYDVAAVLGSVAAWCAESAEIPQSGPFTCNNRPLTRPN